MPRHANTPTVQSVQSSTETIVKPINRKRTELMRQSSKLSPTQLKMEDLIAVLDHLLSLVDGDKWLFDGSEIESYLIDTNHSNYIHVVRAAVERREHISKADYL